MIAHKKLQAGASLLFVLFVLVLLTSVGVLALRISMTSLSVATNSQIQMLLQQSSDAALFRMQDPAYLDGYYSGDGPLGLMSTESNSEKELVFCFRADKGNLFELSDASLIYADTAITKTQTVVSQLVTNSIGTSGYCNASRSLVDAAVNFFTSNRRAVITQLTVRQFSATDAAILEGLTEGTDEYNAKIAKSSNFEIYATSLVPGFGQANVTDINTCLSSHMSNPAPGLTGSDAISLTDCLATLNVPFSTQVATYSYKTVFIN